jgi:hypothetical protein
MPHTLTLLAYKYRPCTQLRQTLYSLPYYYFTTLSDTAVHYTLRRPINTITLRMLCYHYPRQG